MRVSKFTIGLLFSVILLAIFFAKVGNFLSTDTLDSGPNEPLTKNMKIDDSFDHLIWILQISDIHISMFTDMQRITEFQDFCNKTLSAINPAVVLASGDLTDAKTSDAIGSMQIEDEWKIYRDILNKNNITDKVIWLDIRGNHDNFNVAKFNSNQNFYNNYSIQGQKHPRSYMYQIVHGSEKYSFIGIDACIQPGPKRPFNFVGVLDENEIGVLKSLVEKVEASGSNYTIWFGHFPTSCILTPPNTDLRSLIGKHRNGLIYVCGHLHTLGGLVPQMYTMQHQGFLELELGDWKENRVFRLMAIDHGSFSFVDIRHYNWPLILVTNPKNALYINPLKDNLRNTETSTHIRILAFSEMAIDYVKVRIDEGRWIICNHIKGPLYVSRWDPSLYSTGLHKIEVLAIDMGKKEKIIEQYFSLDGTRLAFNILPKIALMTDASYVFKVIFMVTLVLCMGPLFVFRITHKLVKQGRLPRPRLQGWYSRSIRKYWILCTINRLFFPLALYPLYLAVGPWCIGYLVEDNIGMVFAWGIYVNGSYLPGSFTYAYGFVQLLFYEIPMILILARIVDQRFDTVALKIPVRRHSITRKVNSHLPFLLVFAFQIVMAYLFWLAYGTLAFILGPLRTWSIFLSLFMYYQALHLPEESTRKAAEVWVVRRQERKSTMDIQ